MNSFFMKNLISSNSNPQREEEQQSDFQRLIQLCNSYGLNEEQTKQLIDEFKKGSYKSGTNSLNQSMMSEQNDISMSQNCDQSERHYQHEQNNPTQQQQNRQHKQNNFYHQAVYDHQGQSTNRYYGYANQMQQKDEESYNEMTFNQQNNSLMMNSHQFYEVQGHFAAESSRENTLRQQMLMHQKMKQKLLQQKNNRDFIVEQKPLQRNNSRKEQLTQPIFSQQQCLQNLNQGSSITQSNKNSRQSISTKMISQQNQKSSSHQSSKHQKRSQQTSKSSQISVQEHSVEIDTNHGLNPEYVKALIRNFQMLESQNEDLKEENQTLHNKAQRLIKQNESIKKQNDQLKTQLDQIKNRQKMFNNETVKLEALFLAEKQKSDMLLNMKQKDSEVIKGLKDSLIQLTELIKQKDTQNNELQQKLFTLYQKIQNQSQYPVRQEFNYTGSSAGTSYAKSFSKKSLTSQQCEKDMDSQQKSRQRQRTPNYGRRQLAEMMINNINLPSSNQSFSNNQISQQNKQLAREPSASRLNSSSNEQAHMKKQPSYTQQNKQVARQSKQNVFTPLQVEPSVKRNPSQANSKQQQDDMKKRPSSRVDIKKYKGMIEELRNSYSNVGNGNHMMR